MPELGSRAPQMTAAAPSPTSSPYARGQDTGMENLISAHEHTLRHPKINRHVV